MADVLAQITEPGDPNTVRVDVNDDIAYTLDPRTDLGRLGMRRTLLEAANVDGATVAARSHPMMQALLVVNIKPQSTLVSLVAAYEALKNALDTPCSLSFAMDGWDPDDPFYIDIDSADDFPNLVSGKLPWVPGCDPLWFADTLAITVLRYPRSYGAGDFL